MVPSFITLTVYFSHEGWAPQQCSSQISSSFALQVFKDASAQVGLDSVVPPDKGIHGPFLCLPCCNQLEKMSKLKANLHTLSSDVVRKIKETASHLGVSIAVSDET